MAKKLMIVSGVINGLAGVLLIFMPEELLLWTDGETGKTAILAVSLFGTAILGFGMMNYIGRNAIYGGIYGKPILLGNLIFHAVAAVTLINYSINSNDSFVVYTVIAGALYSIFAAGFIRLNFYPST